MIRALALAATLAVAAMSQAHATVVYSDAFESDALGLNTTPAGWTISGGAVDTIGSGYFDFLPGNGHYIDLDGSTGVAGLMSTSLTLAANTTYELSFSMAGNHRSGDEYVTVNFGSASTVIHTLQNDPFATYTLSFTTGAAGAYSLSFQDASRDNVGALLDNVQVSSVPEPASVALMLAGLGAVGVAARRRRG